MALNSYGPYSYGLAGAQRVLRHVGHRPAAAVRIALVADVRAVRDGVDRHVEQRRLHKKKR